MASTNRVRLKDIAEIAQVSVSAVSLALRNSPKIPSSRRKRIQNIAKKLGYKRDSRMEELMTHLRQSRDSRSSSLMAILIPEIALDDIPKYPRIKQLIAGVTDFANRVGFEVKHYFLNTPGMNSKIARSQIIKQGIKGVVALPFPSGVAELDFDFTDLCVATAGFSIIAPKLHRACPDYLKMMDEMLELCVSAGHRRVGLILTKTGGTGFKLFTSSFLFFQSNIPVADRVPMLDSAIRRSWHDEGAAPATIKEWIQQHKPDAIIGSAQVLSTIQSLGYAVPKDIGFVSIDVSEPPIDAAGANHCFEMVGEEAFRLMLTSLNLNLTGVPEHPRVVMVDSHQQPGFSLRLRSKSSRKNRATSKRSS